MIDILIRMVVRWCYVNFHENNKHAKKTSLERLAQSGRNCRSA